MKIAVIADTHYGVRNDNSIFLDANEKFVNRIFLPEIERRGIHTIIHLGDLVDRRKYININTAHRLRTEFLNPILDRNIKYHQILGNHDVFFKNTNNVNVVKELYHGIMSYYETPQEIVFDGLPVLFLPWISPDIRNMSMTAVAQSKALVCMGHLEIQGFQMEKGTINHNGDSRTTFDKFDQTFSGHFHHKSTDGSIFYLGSHAQFTWGDYPDQRGFHIFDTETLKLEFIENPYQVFSTIEYDDANRTIQELLDYDFSAHKHQMVRVIINSKTNHTNFDLFYQELEKQAVADIQIVNRNEIITEINSKSENVVVGNTLQLFKDHIKENEFGVCKDDLETTILNLYNEAINTT